MKKDLENAKSWQNYAEEAELVKANLHIITGKGKYSLAKYSEGSVCTIEYIYTADTTPKDYMAKLYKKAAKLSRAVDVLKCRLEEVSQLLKFADEQLYFAEGAEIHELKELANFIKKNVLPQKSKQGESDFKVYKHRDVLIYIGCNSISNQKLLRFANSGDVWLHAHEMPSAHGIIRGKVNEDTLLYAASIVAYFSKQKGESIVPVDYTFRKHVKKPKDTPPGFVIYTNYKTLFVKPAISA